MNSTSSQSDRLRRVQSLIQEIAGKGKDVSLDDVESCRQLVETSRRLCCELESPSEAVFRIVIVQPVLSMAIRTAVQLNLFTAMEGEGKPRHTVKELAAHTGADPVLLSRIMSQMAAMDFLREIGPNSYELTHVSKCLRDQIYQDPFKYTYEITIPVLRMTSQYLAETKYTNPSIFRDTPFQMAHRTKQSLYEYFVSHPEIGGQFSNFMIMINQGRPQWFDADHFPVQKLLGSEANIKDDKDVLMVDIGGGQGQDVTLFRKRYPDLSGRLILQDTPQVIQQAGDLPHGIEGMPYNFFTPQPIKGQSFLRSLGLLRLLVQKLTNSTQVPKSTTSIKSSTPFPRPSVSKSSPTSSPPCKRGTAKFSSTKSSFPTNTLTTSAPPWICS